MAESRKFVALSGAAGFALLALTGAALADGYSVKDTPKEEPRKLAFSFSISGVSDYIFRGISLSDNDPTIQGSITATYGIFYATVWSSGLDWGTTDPNAQVEVDYYAGIKPTWGKANFDFGVLYYTYPGTADVFVNAPAASGKKESTSILELKASVSGEILPKLTGTATYYLSPDVDSYKYSVFEGSLAYALPKTWIFDPTVSGTLGYQDSYNLHLPDYAYWNAGLTLAVDKISFDFRYWGTDLSKSDVSTFYYANTSVADDRFVFTTTVTLP